MRVCVKLHFSELITPFESHNERIVTHPPPPATGCTVRGRVQRHQQGSYGLLCVICHMSLLFQAPPRDHPLPHNLLSRDVWQQSIGVCACVRACSCACMCVRACVRACFRVCVWYPCIRTFSPFYHPHPSVSVLSQILKRECAGCGV